MDAASSKKQSILTSEEQADGQIEKDNGVHRMTYFDALVHSDDSE
jgi:hypothetical protein